jgi:signal transduction histidine kinase
MLVAVALLPAVAIQAYNEFDLRRAREVEVKNQALSLAKLAAAEQQQIVQGIRQVLIALSELPAIKARDAQACNAYLSTIKQRYPEFLTFAATDMNGEVFCNSISNRKPETVAGRTYFAHAVKTGSFAVGELTVGRFTGQNILPFALPFYGDDGRMSGVILAGLGLDWLADYLALKGVPSGAALSITDRNGSYLARYPNNGRFVGSKMPGNKYLTMDGRGTVDVVAIDGVQRIVGYATLGAESGGIVVSYSLNRALAFSEIQERSWRGFLLITLSTSLVLALTSFGARRFIHRPLGELVDAANQWRLGEFSRRVNIQGKSEIGRVAEAFNTMADALEHRECELSKAKEKAEEAAARITMIFESTTDSVIIVDREWRVSFLNARGKARVAGARDIIGMSLWEALPDATAPEIAGPLRAAMSVQRPLSLEALCVRLSVWFALNAFPSSQGLAIFLRDITEQRRAAETRRLIEEQLHQSQKMEAVGQLTGGVAHDFNNLLSVVSGNLELIVADPGDDGRVRRLAAAALHATNRGAGLTAQLLAFSRRQRLNPKLVDANHLVREFKDLIRQAVGEECEIKLLTDEQLWQCNIDPTLLQTALLNLALNGRDAMPNGGTLAIETRNIDLDDAAAAGCAPGAYVRLSVSDTGCGMTPEVRDRVFEPFFTTKELGKGTGLGLSMVYGFVRQSGGHVAVESAVGVGTTVSLYLPQATQLPDVEDDAVEVQSIHARSERLLLVEDDESLLQITSEILTDFGYQVFSARNGVEAIEILERDHNFDLMLSDVVMPFGLSGVELGRKARQLSKGIKVLLTSGHTGDVLERHGAAGEFPIIDKPFRRLDLAQRLQSLVHEA